jgi:hypothetical protein
MKHRAALWQIEQDTQNMKVSHVSDVGAPDPFDSQMIFSIFMSLCRRGMTYGAAGVWLDTFSLRLNHIHSARWNVQNVSQCAQHDQAGAKLSHLLRRMTRRLRGLQVDSCCQKNLPAGQWALKEIACQAGALIAELRTAGHACHDEALCALKDALLDENEELIGPWLKRDAQPQ